MSNFNDKLQTLLKTDSRFVDQEWDLLRNEVIDKAFKIDEKLIELLISDDEIKSKFFCEIKGHWVFNINTFVDFIQDKNFLNDSYTKYKNKIWLNIGWKFLSERKEISLVRPYKDCILEWWQNKEDQKRKEIFFNETLAQDEIDRLLDPKVLTNWEKYTKSWEQKVKEFSRDDNWNIKDNLIIKGNNLLALHTLKKEFTGRVKLIYIDPPYNTWNDWFKYNDNFNHSTWLTFMKNRLEVAKCLLRDDWIIFIQIDDKEHAYLKVLMDDIFEEDHFISSISVRSSTPSWLKTAHRDKTIIKTKDHILVYSKNKNIIIKPQYILQEQWDSHYSFFLNKDNMKLYSLIDILVEKWILKEPINLEKLDTADKKIKEFYIKYKDCICRKAPTMPKEIKQKTLDNPWIVIKYNDIDDDDWISEEQYAIDWNRLTFLSKKIKKVLIKKWNNVSYQDDLSLLLCDFRGDIDFQNTQNEWWIGFPAGKKPEMLLYRIIDMCTKEWDIILDYHWWSWTTGAVAHKMNRQRILIEQMDYIKELPQVRLQKVIQGEQSWISKAVNRQWGWEFIYCELKKYNQDFIDQIEVAKDTKELLKIWEDMKTKSFLNYNVDIVKQDKAIEEFKQLSLDQQKKALVELLDKNQLYVNLSEINDKFFEVSEEDKRLNSLFYNL